MGDTGMTAKAKTIDTEADEWIGVIALYEREFKKWEQQVEKITKRYKDETKITNEGGSKFNIFWSNVQTSIPAVFSRLPQPDVSRRYKDTDPVGRVAALLLERALEFEVNHYPDYRAAMNQSVLDRFLGGRGTSWIRYEPHISSQQAGSEDGDEVTEDTDEAPAQELEYECAPADYVHWRDFGHTLARTWEEVTAVWRKVYMGRETLVERFGEEKGAKVPLDTAPEDVKKTSGGDKRYQALIYEIWDKKSGKVRWLSKSLGTILDKKPDPLRLDNFWPCPKPLYATLTNESLVPIPDFSVYQDQAKTLDILSDRIEGLCKALQVKGCYNAAVPELARLFTEGQNTNMIPVTNWQAFAEKQGLQGAINLVDLTPIFNALKACYEAAEQQKNQIYELTGLSDIIRAATDPNETATAQKMKGNFGSMRLRAMQQSVAQFATEILQIKAQIICKFTPETLMKIGGAETLSEVDQQSVPAALQLLANSTLRDFRIEIVADSMIYMDELQEKQDRMEMLNAMGNFLKEAVPAATDNPPLAPLLMSMMRFGATSFKIGKQIEGEFDQVADQLTEQAKQPQQPKPDPEMAKIQMQGQMEQQKMAGEQQLAQFKANLDAQVAQAQQQAQAQQEQQQEQLEAQRAAQDAQLKSGLEQHKASLDAETKRQEFAFKEREAMLKSQSEAQRLDFERYKAELDAKTKIAVAEIAASSSLQAAQLSAAKAEAEGGQIPAGIDKIVGALNSPRKLVRGPDGRASGSEVSQ